MKQNYYGNLCTEMYEILHAKAPQDELEFYLSYAKKGQKKYWNPCVEADVFLFRLWNALLIFTE